MKSKNRKEFDEEKNYQYRRIKNIYNANRNVLQRV